MQLGKGGNWAVRNFSVPFYDFKHEIPWRERSPVSSGMIPVANGPEDFRCKFVGQILGVGLSDGHDSPKFDSSKAIL